MTSTWRDELDDLDGEFTKRGNVVPPELRNRLAARGVQKRTRRNRPNEMAKRGMHQRRKKRLSW